MKKIIVSISICLLLMGCFAQHQETVQKDSISYLRFTGNISDARFVLTNEQIQYPSAFIQSGKRYAVKPGVYRLTVMRNGIQKVHRKLFFADGETREVNVP